MGAHPPVYCSPTVTVETQDPYLWGKVIADYPAVELPFDFFPVPTASSVDVIQGEESGFRFSTTPAASPIGRDHSQLQFLVREPGFLTTGLAPFVRSPARTPTAQAQPIGNPVGTKLAVSLGVGR